MRKPDLPLKVEMQRGVVRLSVGAAVLAFAATNHPYRLDEKGTPLWKVVDAVKFSEEVVRAMNREAEDGSNLITRMLDQAISDAVDDGAEGVEY